MITQLFIGSQNPDKVQEIALVLGDLPLRLVFPNELGPLPTVEETGATFAENAALKALAYGQVTGLPALADDSGLEVDCLGGEPGVHSARWAGVEGRDRYAANNRKLLERLKLIPAKERQARFVCVIALADEGKIVFSCRGECHGRITLAARGEHGFGYDPFFEIEGTTKTMAELEPEIKNQISHRARALTAFRQELSRWAKFTPR